MNNDSNKEAHKLSELYETEIMVRAETFEDMRLKKNLFKVFIIMVLRSHQ